MCKRTRLPVYNGGLFFFLARGGLFKEFAKFTVPFPCEARRYVSGIP